MTDKNQNEKEGFVQQGLIYKKIPAIMADVSAIGKDRENVAQHYSFRGIDDVYNEVHEVFAKHRVFTIPVVLDAKHEERKSKSGGVLIYRIYTIKYIFYAEDGSFVEATVIGEGMDSGDKAGNKALSVAHKYALLQVLLIPTDDPKDPENESPQVNGKPQKIKSNDTSFNEDIREDSEKDSKEKEAIASWVKLYLEKKTIDYAGFKKFIQEISTQWTPTRKFVGKQFGNLSLNEGKLADLRYLKNNIDIFIDKYLEKEMKK